MYPGMCPICKHNMQARFGSNSCRESLLVQVADEVDGDEGEVGDRVDQSESSVENVRKVFVRKCSLFLRPLLLPPLCRAVKLLKVVSLKCGEIKF